MPVGKIWEISNLGLFLLFLTMLRPIPALAKYNPLMQIEAQKVRPLVSIVIDKSGSMRWDFGGGMYDNLNACRQRSNPGSRINVVRNLLIDTPTFYDGNNNCAPQDPMQMVNGMFQSMNLGLVWFSFNAWIEVNVSASDDLQSQVQKRDAINQSIRTISPGGSTNIGAGLQQGINDLVRAGSPQNDPKQECGRKRFVLLVTDGANNQPWQQRRCHIPLNEGLTGSIDCFSSNCLLPSNRNDNSQCLMYTQADRAFRSEGIRVFPVAIAQVATNGRVLYTMNRVACLGGVDAALPGAGLDMDWSAFMTAHNNCDHTFLLKRTQCGLNPADPACKDVGGLGHLAFPAETPQRFRQVMDTIVSLLAVGDFNSSRPTATFSASAGNIAIFATAELPGWKGHLYRFDQDLLDQDGDGDTREFLPNPSWDAAEQLCKRDNNAACSFNDLESRNIYFDQADAQHTLMRIPTDKQLDLAHPAVSAVKTTAQTVCTDTAWWDDTTNGCPNVLRVVDFILGGDGTCSATGSGAYLMGHNPRPWLLGPIIGSQPVIIGKPLRYSLNKGPTKTSFDARYTTRQALIVVGSDDGLLHAFDEESGQELWAFLPAPLLCQVPRRLETYDPNLAPTGQAGTTQSHIFGINTTPSYADIIDETETDTTTYPERWKTVLYFGLADGARGAYALDVTCAHPGDTVTCADFLDGFPDQPPFRVQWALNGGIYGGKELGKIWQIVPIGLFQQATTGPMTNWAVVLTSGLGLQNMSNLGIFVFASDTGNLIKAFDASSQYADNPVLTPPEEGILAGPTLMETDTDVYFHDSIVTHILVGDLSGAIHAINASSTNTANWVYNFPAVFRFFSDHRQTYHHDLAVAHLNKSFNYLVAFNTGSLFEDQLFYRGSLFQPAFGLSLLFLDPNSRDMRESTDPANRKVFQVRADVQLCADFDATTGNCNQFINPSPLARFTSQPLVVVDAGNVRKSGVALNLLFDPEVKTQIPAATGTQTICGTTFRIRVPFQVNPQGPNGDQTAFIPPTGIEQGRNIRVGAGVVSGIGRTLSGAFVIQSGIGKGRKARPEPIEEEWSLQSALIQRFKVMF